MRTGIFSRRSTKVVAAAAVAIGAIGVVTSSARGQTELSFVVPRLQNLTVDYVQDERPGQGTRIVSRAPILEDFGADRIGTGYFDCVVQRNAGEFFAEGLFVCDALFKLADGEVMVTGLDPGGVSEAAIAVTGGTRTARLEVTARGRIRKRGRPSSST